MLLATIEPELDNGSFLVAMGVLGVGMGLIVSQLGNVVQSAVGDADRSEAGGLQNTAQQLGSSLGTALLGAIVITGLIAAFTANVADDPRISDDVSNQVEVQLSAGGSFVAADGGRAGAEAAGLDPATVDALVDHYEDAQLKALKTAFLFAAFLVLASFWTTRRLPTRRFDELQAGPDPPLAEPALPPDDGRLDPEVTPARPRSAPPPARPPAPRRRAPATASGSRRPTGRTRSSCWSSQAGSRVGHLVPLRYGRMLVSPFTFYRGAAAVMAADLAPTPRSGFETQLCGDAHLSNFGGFASPERRLVFDLNDFDETLPGPWEWDVKRLVASFSLAGRDRGCAGRRAAADRAGGGARIPRDDAAAGARWATSKSWYQQLDADAIAARWADAVGGKQRKAFERNVAKAQAKDSDRAFAKLAEEVDGELRIVSDPPLIVPIEELAERGAGGRRRSARAAGPLRLPRLARRSSAAPCSTATASLDVAFKVVGVGSVGTRAWIALMLGRDERRPAVPADQGGAALGARALHRAERVRPPGRAGRPRAAADADGERRPARLGAGEGDRRRAARLLRAPALGLEGLGAGRGDGRPRPRRLRARSAA